ncbi:MAG: hypothetical protein ACYDHW_06995 [Syntrophorhabdaceae bacterium]
MKRTAILILCLTVLTACSSIVRTEYVKPTIPEMPAAPVYSKVQWQKVGDLYCTTAEGAKDVMRNHLLCKDDAGQCRMVIEGLR